MKFYDRPTSFCVPDFKVDADECSTVVSARSELTPTVTHTNTYLW